MKLTLEKTLQLIAEEMTRRHIERLSFFSQYKNYETIKEKRLAQNLELLKSEIKPEPEDFEESLWFKSCRYYKPFDDYSDTKSFPDKIIVIAKQSEYEGNKLFFRLINPAVEGKTVSEILLSLEEKQLDDAYVIYKGVVQKFKVIDGKVVYEDVLVIEEEESPEDKNTKATKKRELERIKKLELVEDMIDELTDELKRLLAVVHSLKSGKW